MVTGDWPGPILLNANEHRYLIFGVLPTGLGPWQLGFEVKALFQLAFVYLLPEFPLSFDEFFVDAHGRGEKVW